MHGCGVAGMFGSKRCRIARRQEPFNSRSPHTHSCPQPFFTQHPSAGQARCLGPLHAATMDEDLGLSQGDLSDDASEAVESEAAGSDASQSDAATPSERTKGTAKPARGKATPKAGPKAKAKCQKDKKQCSKCMKWLPLTSFSAGQG
eukprot:3233991-Alexandrium_andersonii.AAC.1